MRVNSRIGGPIKKILSPYADDYSAITDCRKLAESGFEGRRAILIYGFEDPQRPLAWLIDAFEAVAALTIRLGPCPREQAPLSNLIHPVFGRGHVYAWEILTAELTATSDDGHEKLPRCGQIAARWRP